MPTADLEAIAQGRVTLILGDDSEWHENDGSSCMAAAARIEWDAITGSIGIHNSITALPPIFVARGQGFLVLASALDLIRAIARIPLRLEPASVLDLFRFGYPLDYRTLFIGVTLMPAGHRLTFDERGVERLSRAWHPAKPDTESCDTPIIERELIAFERAVRRLQLDDSIFALTAGLDTRAILALLTKLEARPIACTITGDRSVCLDARVAQTLCKEYGLRHVLITLDKSFRAALPHYIEEASRRSGGLAGLEQAHEVHFYEMVVGLGSRRLSGNLGNQVGRRGVEGVAFRGADVRVLHERLTVPHANINGHWLSTALADPEQEILPMLLEREVPFSSVGNYGVGQSFMIQQTPYADANLIDVVLRSPAVKDRVYTTLRVRLRDLRHRFLGPSRDESFQCRAVRDAGGVLASTSINWGWRVTNGISLRGLSLGLGAFADALTSTRFSESSIVRKTLATLGACGLSETCQPRLWIDTSLREFVIDTLRSRQILESDLFDSRVLERFLDEHYEGTRPHHSTLIAALDLAVASQTFSTPGLAITEPGPPA